MAFSIDFRRHRLLYEALFSHLGYEVKLDYDMNLDTGTVYKIKSSFYLLVLRFILFLRFLNLDFNVYYNRCLQ